MPYETRKRNRDAHPGAIDRPAARRTRAQVSEAKQKKADLKAAEAKNRSEALQRAADMEGQMRQKDEDEQAARVKKTYSKKPANAATSKTGT